MTPDLFPRPREISPTGGAVDLAAELAALAAEHRERWLERSRPGGQPDSERHLRRAAAAHRARSRDDLDG
jgi:hypothetical protein